MPFSGVFGTKGSIGTGCAALLPDINRRPNLCPPGAGPTRLRQEGWLQNRRVWIEIASEAKQERAERKKVLALAQTRKVDLILVTARTRTRDLNEDLDDLFRRWYPKFRSQPQTQEPERKAA